MRACMRRAAPKSRISNFGRFKYCAAFACFQKIRRHCTPGDEIPTSSTKSVTKTHGNRQSDKDGSRGKGEAYQHRNATYIRFFLSHYRFWRTAVARRFAGFQDVRYIFSMMLTRYLLLPQDGSSSTLPARSRPRQRQQSLSLISVILVALFSLALAFAVAGPAASAFCVMALPPSVHVCTNTSCRKV